MTVGIKLPYFDFLLDLLASKDPSVEQAFGRHVHWGYWPDPASATGQGEDYAAAAERLALVLLEAAGVRPQERILDVGCGFGGTTALLNDRFEGMDLRGLNPDIRQLERARSLVSARPGNTVFFEEGDACALPYPESRFDRVLALESIFHFPSRERFFREAFRTLRAGGTLAITDFVPSAAALPLVRLATEMPALGRFQYFGRCDLSFTRRAYRRLAERVGFVPVAGQDITLHTLPTYRFLNGLVDHSPLPKGTKIAAETLLKMMSLFSNAGLLTYHLFTFQKPDGVASDKRG